MGLVIVEHAPHGEQAVHITVKSDRLAANNLGNTIDTVRSETSFLDLRRVRDASEGQTVSGVEKAGSRRVTSDRFQEANRSRSVYIHALGPNGPDTS